MFRFPLLLAGIMLPLNLESVNTKTANLGPNFAKTVFYPSLFVYPLFFGLQRVETANNEGRLYIQTCAQ
jgi:hypothetical protein